MIIVTRECMSYLHNIGVNKEYISTQKIEKIVEWLPLDPTLSNPTRDIIIFSSDVIRPPRVRESVVKALMSQHPNIKTIFINKTGKDLPGFDANLVTIALNRPSKDDIKDAIKQVTSTLQAKPTVDTTEIINSIDDYTPEEPQAEESIEAEVPETVQEMIEQELPLAEPEPEPEPVVEEEQTLNLLSRIKSAESITSIMNITKELDASRIVTEITQANAAYRSSEAYVKNLNTTIEAICADPEYTPEEALKKIRGLLHDRSSIQTKANGILEESVEEIIINLVDKAKQFISQRVKEINDELIKASQYKQLSESPNIRFATVLEQRRDVLLDLQTLDLELQNITNKVTTTVQDVADKITSDANSSLGSPLLDAQIKIKYGTIAPDNLLDVLKSLFTAGENSQYELGSVSQIIQDTISKVYELLACYKEENEILAETIKFLKANNVEDGVIAESIKKKTLRVIITDGTFEPAALSYIFTNAKSRGVVNAMILDLTGRNYYKTVGVETHTLQDLMSEHLFSKFEVFETSTDGELTEESLQGIINRLMTYANQYAMINLVITKDQVDMFKSIFQDVLSITYLVDCFPTNIQDMKGVIAKSKTPNTGQRVVLYNYVTDSGKICEELGVMDDMGMGLATVEPLPELKTCALRAQDPYDVPSIVKSCEGMTKC